VHRLYAWNRANSVVPGYQTPTCNNLRLWGSKAASGEFDFQKFNSGEYEASVSDQQRAETISAVLYPNDKYVLFKPTPLEPLTYSPQLGAG
jgi:glucan phosphorylase